MGLGKIARDQHMPALAANDAFELVAVASPHQKSSDLPNFNDLPALIQALPEVAAVALCTPPQVRYEIARYALDRACTCSWKSPRGDGQRSRRADASRPEKRRGIVRILALAACGRRRTGA